MMGLKATLMLTIVLTACAQPAAAQLLGARAAISPRWDAGVNIGLRMDGDPLLTGAGGVSGSGRITHWLFIAGKAGRQQQGYAHCKDGTCLPDPPPGFCPCDGHPFQFSSTFAVAGPRIRITERMFTHVLVGGIWTDILPTRFVVRPGVGWDYGGEVVKFRLEVDYDVVPEQKGLSGYWLVLGVVVRGR